MIPEVTILEFNDYAEEDNDNADQRDNVEKSAKEPLFVASYGARGILTGKFHGQDKWTLLSWWSLSPDYGSKFVRFSLVQIKNRGEPPPQINNNMSVKGNKFSKRENIYK